MKRKVIAFEDTELSVWLMDLIVDGSGSFLSALAEIVVTADAEDYSIMRPGLIELKRKHSDRHPKRLRQRNLLARSGAGRNAQRGEPEVMDLIFFPEFTRTSECSANTTRRSSGARPQ